MKIVWIADYTVEEHVGGAQQTNDLIVKKGLELGHDVEIMTIKTLRKPPRDSLLVLNNLREFWNKDPNIVFEWIENYKYVRYEHDYFDSYLPAHVAESIFENSSLNIFLSPAHYKEHLNKYPIFRHGVFNPYVFQPSPIDTSIFNRDGRMARENTAIYAGGVEPHKGVDNIILFASRHSEVTFFIVGWGGESYINKIMTRKPDNVHFLGTVDHKVTLPELYRKTEFVIHMPRWVEPFGRAYMEAIMCGCKPLDPLHYGRIGCMSYEWSRGDNLYYEEIKRTLENASALFWQNMSRLVL